MSDLYPLDSENMNQAKLNADTNRHREIIIKAISAILLLMLKHFKVNHIYQVIYLKMKTIHIRLANNLIFS